MQREKLHTPGISSAIGSLRERSQLFFSLMPAGDGRFSFNSRKEFLEENGEEYDALNQSLRRIGAELEKKKKKPEQVFSIARRAQQLQVHLGFVMEDESPNTVFWIERRGFRVVANRLADGACPSCTTPIPGRWDPRVAGTSKTHGIPLPVI
jgi:ATP-dependent DNA helicase DinG